MSRFSFKRSRRVAKRVPRSRVKRSARRLYVKGYGGGRPGYGTMARNAWPFRSAPKRNRGSKRRDVVGNWRTTRVVKGGRSTSRSKMFKKVSQKHTVISKGAFTVDAAFGQQLVTCKTFQVGPVLPTYNGTQLESEAAIWGTFVSEDGSRYLKERTHLAMDCANACNSNITVDFYDVEYKDNKAYSASDLDAKAYWSWALDKAFQGTAPVITDPYCPFPQTVPIVRDNLRITGHKRVHLNPGQVHKHIYARKLNKICDWSNVFQGGAGSGTAPYANWLQYVKGFTYSVMVVVNGMPVSSAADKTKVNFGAAKVNCTWVHHSDFYRVDDSTAYLGLAANTVDPVQTFADAEMVNDDDGAVTAYAKA